MKVSTCTSSLYTSTYGQLEPEFGASRLVCTLGLSLFVAGLGAGPMILSPLSEVRPQTQVHARPRMVLCSRTAVLRPPANLHWLVHVFPYLADPVRRCSEYADNADRKIF